MPTTAEARHWLDRWDRQQERFVADREERFTVIADVVAAAVGTEHPIVVDLGAGPGSLSVRLLDRIPDAQVIAVDADPLLLGLARAAYGDVAGLRIVEHDLRATGWVDAIGASEVDAVVSTTALHWLTADELAAVYRAVADLVRPGGVFVDGDNFDEGPGRDRIGALAARVTDARAARVGVLDREDWASWWDAVGAAPELADLSGIRGARPIDHTVADEPTIDDHVARLRAAGFAEAGTVWQHGTDRVLVGVR